MREERRIAGHLHDVTIAFQANHARGLRQSAFEVVSVVRAHCLDTLRGIFTEESLWAIAIIIIVAMRIGEEPVRSCIAMFVYDIGAQFTKFWPGEFEMLIIWLGAGAGDQQDLRVPGLQGSVEFGVTLDVLLIPLFV